MIILRYPGVVGNTSDPYDFTGGGPTELELIFDGGDADGSGEATIVVDSGGS